MRVLWQLLSAAPVGDGDRGGVVEEGADAGSHGVRLEHSDRGGLWRLLEQPVTRGRRPAAGRDGVHHQGRAHHRVAARHHDRPRAQTRRRRRCARRSTRSTPSWSKRGDGRTPLKPMARSTRSASITRSVPVRRTNPRPGGLAGPGAIDIDDSDAANPALRVAVEAEHLDAEGANPALVVGSVVAQHQRPLGPWIGRRPHARGLRVDDQLLDRRRRTRGGNRRGSPPRCRHRR